MEGSFEFSREKPTVRKKFSFRALNNFPLSPTLFKRSCRSSKTSFSSENVASLDGEDARYDDVYFAVYLDFQLVWILCSCETL